MKSLFGAVGQDPLPYPTSDDPAFAEKQKAWQEQNRIFQGILANFAASNMNIKEIFKGLIMSPIYRTVQANGLSPGEMEPFGTGRLLTPESLSRRLAPTTGVRWVRYDRQDNLPTDYNLLYGGIDFDNVVKRLTTPNAIIGNVGQRMANEVTCSAVAWDLLKAKDQRLLFPFVEVSQIPEDINGFPVPASIENIKKNIQYLHYKLLGETIEVTDPEIERTYTLFLETYRELQKKGSAAMPYECTGRWDQNTGMALPMNMVGVTDDKYYTVRAWMAVITYLMLDWKYLYE